MKKLLKILSLILLFFFLLSNTTFSAENLATTLKGKILLQVEQNGEAWYVNPADEKRYYMGRPDDAFSLMRELGVGISNDNIQKIQIANENLSGIDDDNDGLSNMIEDSIGTNKLSNDTDNDGYKDKDEILNGYNPNGSGKLNIDNNFAVNQNGKILLQVEQNGEAWYVNPEDSKRYFLGRPADAFSVMRKLGLGISDVDLEKVPYFKEYTEETPVEVAEEGSEEKELMNYIKSIYEDETTIASSKELLPDETTHMRFSFMFPIYYPDVKLDLFIDKYVIYSVESNDFEISAWHNSEFIEISSYAGKDIIYSFVISSPSEGEKEVLIDDILFVEITESDGIDWVSITDDENGVFFEHPNGWNVVYAISNDNLEIDLTSPDKKSLVSIGIYTDERIGTELSLEDAVREKESSMKSNEGYEVVDFNSSFQENLGSYLATGQRQYFNLADNESWENTSIKTYEFQERGYFEVGKKVVILHGMTLPEIQNDNVITRIIESFELR